LRKRVIFGFICHDIFEFQIKNEIENEVENQPKMATVNDPSEIPSPFSGQLKVRHG
jgi:hypothetical protein